MDSPGTKEAKFIKAIKEVFIGTPVEGDSGYINLMRIKARYFDEGVFPRLMQDIEADLSPFPGFREELFDKLYSFFHRYFSESGSIYFRYTPLHQNVYEQVYTDDRDVMLFYKTRMLYYVKTDRLFQNLEVTVDGQRFSFDVSTLEHKKANEKRALVFNFAEQRGDTLVFAVEYSERGSKTKTADILKAIRKLGLKLGENTLTHAFGLFERQSEVDYFINKDARTFLRRQLDLWLYQYVFTGEDQTLWTETRLRQLQVLQKTARNIIDFIAQFEDELVKIWNKPKFALDSNYVITLDKLARRDPDLLRRLADSPGFTAQTAEWQALGLVNDDFTAGHLWDAGLWADESQAQIPLPESEPEAPTLAPAARFLPLDTTHFKDFEPDILALFDDLDDALDGWVINSDNYQALNTLRPKYAGQVQCIYIDPPYNTKASEIIYVNEYKHSSWLTLMENRLQEARNILSKQGILCVAIDDSEYARLYNLLQQIFGENTILGTATIRSNPAGRSTVKGFSIAHEYTIFVANSEQVTIGRFPHSDRQLARYSESDEIGPFEWVNFRKHGGAGANRVDRPRMFYPVFASPNGKIRIPNLNWNDSRQQWNILEQPKQDEAVVYPINAKGDEKRWKWGHESVQKAISDFCAKPDCLPHNYTYEKTKLTPTSTYNRSPRMAEMRRLATYLRLVGEVT